MSVKGGNGGKWIKRLGSNRLRDQERERERGREKEIGRERESEALRNI